MFVVLDLETTGLSAKDDAIIEVAFVKIDRTSFKEVDRYTTFVNPERDIPLIISQITNIFDSDVQDAPKFSQLQDDIQDFIEWLPLIGHNINFDTRFLESHGIDLSKNISIDTFFLANFLCFQLKSLNLWFLCEHFGIKLDNAHRAIDDTLATAKLFEKLIQELQSLDVHNMQVAQYYFSRSKDTGINTLYNEYISWKVDDGVIENIYIKKIKKRHIDIHDISRSGKVENIDNFLDDIPGFELRSNQKTMLAKVDTIFSKWGKTVIEAPTGIGKTFAYLLPAIKHSLLFWEAVHISTSTKALQDQIYYKDLIFLRDNFPYDFSFTKLKGKRNYLSVSAFLDFLDDESRTSAVETSFILKVLFWSMQSEFWELDELDYYGEEYSYLSDINAWNAFTFDESNIYKDIEFAYKARQRAKSSNIIITNNHILFQDMISEGALLWGVKNLVLDEAHSLEDIVTQSLRKNVSYMQFQNLFERINKKIVRLHVGNIDIWKNIQSILFDMWEVFWVMESKLFEKFSFDTKYKNLLLSEDFFKENENTFILVKKVIDEFQSIKQQFSSLDESLQLKFSQEQQEISSIIHQLNTVFFQQNFQENIIYISHDENRGTQIFSTVLHPWQFLKEKLWMSLESIVLTSATLQMQDDFEYINAVLQLDDFDTLLLESDFDYEKQALLYLPNDLWSVKNNLPEITDFLKIFFTIVKGRTLVLFTAFAAIREIYSQLKIDLQHKNTHLLAQSISWSKHKQIDFFKKNSQNSILLWTDTFWEWIDIPGKDLQYLLIHKIPFSVPSDPIFQARSKLFSDSFHEYAIPKAILKLKQGFWRLIRTKKDTGIVVFLDDRIQKSKWWEKFFLAFPENIKIRSWSSQKLLDILWWNE